MSQFTEEKQSFDEDNSDDNNSESFPIPNEENPPEDPPTARSRWHMMLQVSSNIILNSCFFNCLILK